jgi:predicted nucleic acid-binding protein
MCTKNFDLTVWAPEKSFNGISNNTDNIFLNITASQYANYTVTGNLTISANDNLLMLI